MKNPLTNNEIEQIFWLAIEAGEIAKRDFLAKNFLFSTKDDDSEITSTDIAISSFLSESLGKIFPKIPVISEEGSVWDLQTKTFFLIDPIDGTSSFAKGCDQFSINIALIMNQKVRFGLLYAPFFDGGKMIFNDEANQVVRFTPQNPQEIISRPIIGQKIISSQTQEIAFPKNKNLISKVFSSSEIDSTKPELSSVDRSNALKSKGFEVQDCKENSKANSLTIVTSARSNQSDIDNFIAQFLPKFTAQYSITRLSSAIKFFEIIENRHQLYLHFRRSMEWDTAAGQLLVELSGGNLRNLSCENNVFAIGKPNQYQKPHFVNSAFIATSCEFQNFNDLFIKK